MRKLQIILDSDEVIVKNLDKVLELYNGEYQVSLTREEVLDWDLTQVQKEGTNILQYFNQPGFFRHLPLIEDSYKYISKLIEDGHDVVIATSSPKNGILDKIDFFAEYFPFIPFGNVIPITRKDLLRGDIMLDDAPHNLEATQCRYPVIFDNRWNRDTEKYPFLKNLKRVHSWKEFYEVVCQIEKEIHEEEKVS